MWDCMYDMARLQDVWCQGRVGDSKCGSEVAAGMDRQGQPCSWRPPQLGQGVQTYHSNVLGLRTGEKHLLVGDNRFNLVKLVQPVQCFHKLDLSAKTKLRYRLHTWPKFNMAHLDNDSGNSPVGFWQKRTCKCGYFVLVWSFSIGYSLLYGSVQIVASFFFFNSG